MKLRQGAALWGALFTLAGTTLPAQTTVNYTVQDFKIRLTGFVQEESPDENRLAVRSIRITNKDILAAFGLNPRGSMLVATPEGAEVASVWVREGRGSNAHLTDVSDAFTYELLAGPVERSTTRPTTGRVSGVQYSIDRFTFVADEAASSFDVQGFTTTRLPSGATSSQVNGTGTVAAAPAVVRGTVTIGSAKTEAFTVDESAPEA